MTHLLAAREGGVRVPNRDLSRKHDNHMFIIAYEKITAARKKGILEPSLRKLGDRF